MELDPKTEPRSNLSEVVAQAIELYASMLNQMGYSVEGSRTNYQRVFQVLPEEALRKTRDLLVPFLSLFAPEMSELERDPYKPGIEKELYLLKKFIRSKGLVMPGDLESYIRDGDIIEVYDGQGIQQYRSFNFFELCTYSLDEVFTHDWMELYERNEFITRQIGVWAERYFTQQTKDPVVLNLPTHVAREKFSQGRTAVRIKQGVLYPLENLAGQTTMVIATFKVLERLHDYSGDVQTDLGN
ncbi:MAG: hypothetical protein H6624_04440 [Bdellovibrionaceae bacterium]|nr:hypothetical protein [Pseudobdellovibrionaceae bacterium]